MATRKPLSAEELLRMGMPPKSVGEMLKAKRIALGLSKHEVAKRMGVHVKTVQAWEKGKIDVNFVRLLNWVMEGDADLVEVWRRRALVAEAAIRDMTVVLREWRETARSEAGELRDGRRVGGASPLGSSSPGRGTGARAA